MNMAVSSIRRWPSSRKPATAAASRPSQSASTSAVCSPSNGADLTSLGNAVEAHRPGRHRHFAFAVRHRLEDAALPKAGFVDQFLRIEDGARGGRRTALSCAIASCFVALGGSRT